MIHKEDDKWVKDYNSSDVRSLMKTVRRPLESRIADLEQQIKTKDAKIAELEATLNEYRRYIKW